MRKVLLALGFAVATLAARGQYCVIDLSAGAKAASYPVTYLSEMPKGGWSDEFKTAKLVLREIPAGEFVMGGGLDESRRVKLSQPFYLGVFPITQKQWSLVMGSNPSHFPGDERRPVDCVAYDGLRGGGSKWPASQEVHARSFIGILRARTKLDSLDLPTEAQWEYACRAGTSTACPWGDAMDGDFCWCNDNAGSITHAVGEKKPNAWGLYDMIGNVWEWCLDWEGARTYGADPAGPESGTGRVARGGSWLEKVDRCSSSARIAIAPNAWLGDYGFRVCLGRGGARSSLPMPQGEMESDWIAKDGAAPSRAVAETWRKERLERRARRLAPVAAMSRQWVYCRHYVMGGSHYAYTEAISDAHDERTFVKLGSSLCLAEYNPEGLWKETVLLESAEGCYRDVDVSPDAKRILYSFKASDRGDDFHLYEMELATRKVRQLTAGKGVADYEGCYLPDGRIIFNSSRCMQIVDCWKVEVSNLYRCDADGSNITRLTWDQVHDNYPVLVSDGRVFYTRWEYNDRAVNFPQPLFSMNVDGTNQRAVYGANSFFPTTLIHARAVPNSPLFFGVATGHHSLQPGELMRFDPREGREEAEGAWQLEPLRRATPRKVDIDGQQGRMAMYPYPVDEEGVVLSFLPQGWPGKNHRNHQAPFALYWTDVHGNRELLVAQQGKVPCGRPVPVMARKLAPRTSQPPDPGSKLGTVTIRDVYEGEAMKGVPRGTVKSLRVVALEYRHFGVGMGINFGAGGGGLSNTPPSIGNGSWSVKPVLGEVLVAEDGSVAFKVPCRVPVFFQLLDAKGRMVQSMRSWTTLQPGETASCVGCHENLNSAPDFHRNDALAGRAQVTLKMPERGFSYPRDVQPIVERRCLACHNPKTNPKVKVDLSSDTIADAQTKRVWSKSYISLTHASTNNRFKRWMGDSDHPLVNWINSSSQVSLHAPMTRGSRTSKLFSEMLDQGHAKDLTEAEKRVLACWVDLGVPYSGDYAEGANWNDKDRAWAARFLDKRRHYLTESEK